MDTIRSFEVGVEFLDVWKKFLLHGVKQAVK
jgi:hypothetical protein